MDQTIEVLRITIAGELLKEVKSGNINLKGSMEKGNYGEMNMADIYTNMKDLEQISVSKVKSLHQVSVKGIDAVFVNSEANSPKYIVAESKFNTGRLIIFSDGVKQMNTKWIMDRLVDAVGEQTAFKILFEMEFNPENVQMVVLRTLNEKGEYIEEILNGSGHIIRKVGLNERDI